MGVVTKRSSMTYFSSSSDHYSHRVRIVLAEKGVSVDSVDVEHNSIPSELTRLNPYNSIPTLVDRDLVLYETSVMMEYLDERFPHPPLLPVYPVARAESRQFVYRIEKDWCPLVNALSQTGDKPASVSAKKELSDSLSAVAPIFSEKPYFMSEEFTLVDCCLAPILWRLDHFGVQLPKTRQLQALNEYMDRVFKRDSFQASLTDFEREMRPDFF